MDKTELITSIKAMTAEERVKTAYTTMDEEILTILSEDKRWFVREAVASNLNASPKTLESLAEDKQMFVREAVAKNSHTPSEAIETLITDSDIGVREVAKGTKICRQSVKQDKHKRTSYQERK